MLWGPVSGALGAALGAAPGAAWPLVLRALADAQAAFLAGRGGGEAGPPCQLFFGLDALEPACGPLKAAAEKKSVAGLAFVDMRSESWAASDTG
jgi:hypothetical protein